jgi:hypothetical protein
MDGSGKGEGVVPSSFEQVIEGFWGPKASQWGGVIRRSCPLLKNAQNESAQKCLQPE